MNETTLILLVEDDDQDVALTRRALGRSGLLDAEIVRAEKLGAISAVLGDRVPDLILLDLTLPDSTGLDTLSRVRQIFQTIPVVLLTSIDDERLGIEALRAGSEDYARKGTEDMDRLARTVRYAIERRLFRERDPEPDLYRASTGLPGRTIFNDRLTMALRRADHNRTPLAVALLRSQAVAIAIERFGATTAQVFERALLRRMHHAIRLTDTIAVLGNGEYACILESELATKESPELRHLFGQVLAEPIAVTGASGLSRVSALPAEFGMAFCPGDGRTVPGLIGRANAHLAPIEA